MDLQRATKKELIGMARKTIESARRLDDAREEIEIINGEIGKLTAELTIEKSTRATEGQSHETRLTFFRAQHAAAEKNEISQTAKGS